MENNIEYKVGRLYRLNWDINNYSFNHFMPENALVIIISKDTETKFRIKDIKTGKTSTIYLLFEREYTVDGVSMKSKERQFLRELDPTDNEAALRVLYEY